jgi:hypothetical protein
MSEAQHLSDALVGLFASTKHGWFAPFPMAVQGLTAAQALSVPAVGFNAIWSVVNHIRFWHQVVLLRLSGESVDDRELWREGGWPPAGTITDDTGWQAACDGAIMLNAQVAAVVAALDDDEMTCQPAPGKARHYQVIHGLIAHNSYHINEIISLRHMQGWWLERT